MDLKFISEFAGISYCIHPLNLSIFVLTKRLNNFTISEIDLLTKAIRKTYSPPTIQPDSSYQNKNRFEKYTIVFSNERIPKILLFYPYGYLAVFDYETTKLISVNQLHGKHLYFPETICVQTLENSENIRIFFTAENLSPIYMIDCKNYEILQKAVKISKSSHTIITQLKCHPTLPLLYGACSDSLIHIWDYQNLKEIEVLNYTKYKENKSISVGGSISIDNQNFKLIYGNSYGFICIWDIFDPSLKQNEEFFIQKPFGIENIHWLNSFRTVKHQNFVVSFSNGSLGILKYFYQEHKLKPRVEEICTLQQGDENISIPMNIDRTQFIMGHEKMPYIISVWPKYKGRTLLKSTTFLLYPTLYPIGNIVNVSRMANFSINLNEFSPEKPLKSEANLFYISSDHKLYKFSTFDCKSTAILDLQKSFSIGILSYQKFDSRPKRLEASQFYKFLIICTLSTNEQICALLTYDILENKLSEPIKQFAASDANFLGNENEQNPAVLIIQPDRQHVNFYCGQNIDKKYDGFPRDLLELKGKARSIFKTPLNNGFTVVYQSYGEHALKFSQNRKEMKEIVTQKWNMGFLNDSNMSMRLKYDEICFDVIWRDTEMCAIITNQRILISDNKLSILFEYSLSNIDLTSIVTSAWWFENTLLFTSSTHLFYIVPTSPFIPYALTSFPENRVIMGSLIDRIFTYTDQEPKNANNSVKIMPVMLIEPLIIGLLAKIENISDENEKRKNKSKIIDLLSRVNCGLMSNVLIKALNKYGLGQIAIDLVSKPSNPQFIEKDKVEQSIQLGDLKKTLELILGIKDLNNPTEHIITETMLRINTDPVYAYEKQIIKQCLAYAFKTGQYKTAYLCSELLNNQITGYRILQGLNDNGIIEKFVKSLKPEGNLESFIKTDLEYLISHIAKIKYEDKTIRNWKIDTIALENMRAFDKKKLSFGVNSNIRMEDKKIIYEGDMLNKEKKVECKELPTLRDESFGEWLGYDVVITSNKNMSMSSKNISEQYFSPHHIHFLDLKQIKTLIFQY